MNFSKIYVYNTPTCEENDTPRFNELILSWNGWRPQKGKWTFWVSLNKGEWIKYAEWAPNSQRTFKNKGLFAESYQDVVFPKEGYCNGFRVKVEGEDLSQLHSLTVCISDLSKHAIAVPQHLPAFLLSDVPRQSQMVLDHPRHKDLCSPTSTATAINFLLQSKKIDPVIFAELSHDGEFDIYGNWTLNTAEAYNQLEGRYSCHVERLSDFTALHAHLSRGHPVVVSVKGPIPGAPLPYASGHLMCVIGYAEGQVYCIDPGFPTDESTFACYKLEDFLKAWGVRRNLAYIFSKEFQRKVL